MSLPHLPYARTWSKTKTNISDSNQDVIYRAWRGLSVHGFFFFPRWTREYWFATFIVILRLWPVHNDQCVLQWTAECDEKALTALTKGSVREPVLARLPAASTPPTTSSPHSSAPALTSPGAPATSQILTSSNEGGREGAIPYASCDSPGTLVPFAQESENVLFFFMHWKHFKVKVIGVTYKQTKCTFNDVYFPKAAKKTFPTNFLFVPFKSNLHLRDKFAEGFFKRKVQNSEETSGRKSEIKLPAERQFKWSSWRCPDMLLDRSDADFWQF